MPCAGGLTIKKSECYNGAAFRRKRRKPFRFSETKACFSAAFGLLTEEKPRRNEEIMPNYKLLTPGPLTTTDTVKREMLFDHCTWDEDYKQITRKIRRELLRLAHAPEETYTVVLMQGSSTFGVESVVGSSLGDAQKLLVCANGAYGERMAEIARRMGKRCPCIGKTMTGFRTRGGWLRYWRRIRKLPMWA